MGDFGPPFFMLKKFLNEIWLVPTVLLGFLLIVQTVHTHAHYDAHSKAGDLCIGK
jgi:hypothetical protein